MNYVQIGLLTTVLLFSGCVHSTAQWVANQTASKDSNTTSSQASQNISADTPIYSEDSAHAWHTLLSIGFIIVLCCTIPLLCTQRNKAKLTRWRIKILDLLGKLKARIKSKDK